MPYRQQLIDFFEHHSIPYRMHSHEPAYTARQQARLHQLPGRKVAKVVLVAADGRPVMLVLAADRRVDLPAVARFLRRPNIRLLREDELARLFPDCEVGAAPPFGNWYRVPVLIDADLAAEAEITFFAGSHRESVTIPLRHLQRVTRAETAPLAAASRRSAGATAEPPGLAAPSSSSAAGAAAALPRAAAPRDPAEPTQALPAQNSSRLAKTRAMCSPPVRPST